MITLDTLRADHVSAYGYSRNTTPALDRVAEQGALFVTAIASRAETWPALASLHTGVYPRTHGIRRNGQELDQAQGTIAEHLQRAGSRNVAFLTNMTSVEHPGFDEVQVFPSEADALADHHEMDAQATAAAREWLRRNSQDRFFAWLHLIGPHDPYTLSEGRSRRFPTDYQGSLDGARRTLMLINRRKRQLEDAELAHIVSLYDEEVALVDERVGSVLRDLDELGLADDTLVVIMGDHGEELYDHSSYFFHSWSIYQSALQVPLFMRLPGRIAAGLEIKATKAIVEGIDLAPTIFELLGVPQAEAFEGRSLVALLENRSDPSPAFHEAYSELGPAIYALTTPRWQYIHNPERYSAIGVRGKKYGYLGYFRLESEELYDLDTDPKQRVNLAAARPDIAHELRQRILAWQDGLPSNVQPWAPTPKVRAELEALGYIDAPADE